MRTDAPRACWPLLYVATMLGALPPVAWGLDDGELGEREAAVRLMSAGERDQLRRKQERFAHLPVTEQERLRQLESTLSSDPEGEKLRQVMQRYHNWLGALPSSARMEILGLPADQRVAKIKAMRAEQEETRRFQAVNEQDLDKILNWTRERVKQIEPQLLSELPQKDREEINRIEHAHFRYMRLLGAVIRRRGLEKDPARHERVLEITAGDRDELVGLLSTRAQETYRTTPNDDDRRKLMQYWIVRSMFRFYSRSPVRSRGGTSDLRRFLDVEAPNIRDQLDYLPPDRIRAELERFDPWRRDEKGVRTPGGWPPSRSSDGRRSGNDDRRSLPGGDRPESEPKAKGQ